MDLREARQVGGASGATRVRGEHQRREDDERRKELRPSKRLPKAPLRERQRDPPVDAECPGGDAGSAARERRRGHAGSATRAGSAPSESAASGRLPGPAPPASALRACAPPPSAAPRSAFRAGAPPGSAPPGPPPP